MNFIKRFFIALISGAGCWLGISLAKKGIEVAKDPYERARIKQKCKSIKDIVVKKD